MSRRHQKRARIGNPLDDARSTAGAPARRDICSTCNHAETCGHRGTPERPIYFCEEFEAFAPATTTGAETRAPDEPSNRQINSEYKGLCVNCEHRETCQMPKPEGGVWHCEEYR